MANTNTVFGARYWTNPLGGTSAGKLMPFVVADTDATPLFVGDFVKLTGESILSDVPGIGYLPVVTQAAATDVLCGWVEGFGVNPNNLERIYRTASTLRVVWVMADPYAFFVIQSTGIAASGDVGQCADIVVGAGNTFTGLSGMQLDHSTLSSASGQLRVERLEPVAGSEFGQYSKFICFINEHAFKGTVGV